MARKPKAEKPRPPTMGDVFPIRNEIAVPVTPIRKEQMNEAT